MLPQLEAQVLPQVEQVLPQVELQVEAQVLPHVEDVEPQGQVDTPVLQYGAQVHRV